MAHSLSTLEERQRKIVDSGDIDRVRKELEARCAETLFDNEKEDDPEYPPIVVKENVTFLEFMHWSEYEDDKSIGRVEFECEAGKSTGQLVVYTLPGAVQARRNCIQSP